MIQTIPPITRNAMPKERRIRNHNPARWQMRVFLPENRDLLVSLPIFPVDLFQNHGWSASLSSFARRSSSSRCFSRSFGGFA